MGRLEEQTKMDDPDIRKNFLEHKVKSLLEEKWDIDCTAVFKHVLRWEDGPKAGGVTPILVVFEDKYEKDQLWTKLSMKIVDDIVRRRDSITITNVSKNIQKCNCLSTLSILWLSLRQNS